MKKRICSVVLTIFIFNALLGTTIAADTAFKKTKIVVVEDGKTKEIQSLITWKASEVVIEVKEKKFKDLSVTVPYSQMSDLTYERSKHSRMAAALLISPLMLFSKRKHHWFSFNYVNANEKKQSILLRVDKKEERLYRRIVPTLTGLELEEIIED